LKPYLLKGVCEYVILWKKRSRKGGKRTYSMSYGHTKLGQALEVEDFSSGAKDAKKKEKEVVGSLKSHGPALFHVTEKLVPSLESADGKAMTVLALG
jgi:hypothetical protein